VIFPFLFSNLLFDIDYLRPPLMFSFLALPCFWLKTINRRQSNVIINSEKPIESNERLYNVLDNVLDNGLNGIIFS